MTRLAPWFLALLPLIDSCGAPGSREAADAVAPRAARPSEVVPDPTLAQALEELATQVEREREQLHLPGLSLAIVRDGKLVFARGFGLADTETGRATTPETLYCIGSTTKAFTATLVGMLEDEGKLSFDDPVTRALSWLQLPILGEGPVLLRDLMSHRTGFGNMDVLWYGGGASADEVLHTAVAAEPVAPFRTRFLYNNVMFLAAGQACAAVSGSSWQELIRQRFFEPLGMRDSLVDMAAVRAEPRLALGYDWNEDEQAFEHRPMRDLTAIAPAGAIHSNVLDLSHWLRFQLARGEYDGRRLISAERLEETWSENTKIDASTAYGLGWFLGRWNEHRTVFHAGNIDGYSAALWMLPDQGIGVALLCNVSQTPLQSSIGPEVFEALLGKPATAVATAPETATDQAEADKSDPKRFTGTYLANFFQFHAAEFEVLSQDGKLALRIPGQGTFQLDEPDAQGKRAFTLLPEQIQVSFDESAAPAVSLTLYQNGLQFECLRQGYEPPPDNTLAELEPYLGSYADPLSKKTFTLVVSHGRLAVDYPEQMVYELYPPDEHEHWVFRATDQMALEFRAPDSVVFHERGTERVCERIGGVTDLPALDELLRLRGAEAFETRLAALGTCRLEGTLRMLDSGARGRTTTTFDASERYREQNDLAPFLTSWTHFDGKRGRAATSISGEHELSGPALDEARAVGPAVFFGDWSRRFDEAKVVRTLREDGRGRVQVRLSKGEGPFLLVTMDATTGDLVRAETVARGEGAGARAGTVRFEDWRDFEGLHLPARVLTDDPLSGRIVVEYTRLATGVQPALESVELAPADDGGVHRMAR